MIFVYNLNDAKLILNELQYKLLYNTSHTTYSYLLFVFLSFIYKHNHIILYISNSFNMEYIAR